MTWTEKKPTKTGWYWMRQGKLEPSSIFNVFEGDDMVLYVDFPISGPCGLANIGDMEWSSTPIPFPKEPKTK